jgi:hypothetical protein
MAKKRKTLFELSFSLGDPIQIPDIPPVKLPRPKFKKKRK